MKEFKLAYSIHNGGDGSASLRFMESLELAEWDQDHMFDDGWGEQCCGEIVLTSESPIICTEKLATKEQFLIDLVHSNSNYLEDFIEIFYPKGIDNYFQVSKEEHYLIVTDTNTIKTYKLWCHKATDTNVFELVSKLKKICK